jgi:prevent-host-death family protein
LRERKDWVRLVQTCWEEVLMETVGSYEAKTHLPRLLERVARGESITITRHGKPVARLIPIEAKPQPDVEQAIAGLLALRRERAGRALSAAEIKELVNEGRRY